MRRLLLLPMLCLSACAQNYYSSYVGPIDAIYAPKIASDMAEFVQARSKQTGGALCVDQPSDDQNVGPLLMTDLQGSGFVVVTTGCKHRIRYAANTLGSDIMVRISVDHTDGARLYRDKVKTGLSPLGPFSVTEFGE